MECPACGKKDTFRVEKTFPAKDFKVRQVRCTACLRSFSQLVMVVHEPGSAYRIFNRLRNAEKRATNGAT